MVDQSIFAVKDGIATVDRKVLNQVAYERDYKTKLSKGYPKEAGEIYDEIIDIASIRKDTKIIEKGIIVPEKMIRTVGRHEGVAPIENHRLLGHIGTIYMEQKGDKDMSMSIAISCQEKGITIAFGQNVWACTNQCVFGEKVMYTFGKNSTPYDKILEVLREYMNRFEAIKAQEESIIKTMMEIELDSKMMQEIVGDLYINSRRNNLHGSYNSEMLNVSEMGKLIDGIMSPEHEEIDLLSDDFNMSLWDFYNHGTTVLNPLHNNDPVNVLKPNSNLSTYLVDRFGIKIPQLN